MLNSLFSIQTKVSLIKLIKPVIFLDKKLISVHKHKLNNVSSLETIINIKHIQKLIHLEQENGFGILIFSGDMFIL